ncbi:restriction endonuclease subunit S [Vreelandella aquamarina]|uniref:restriction endonuclease subunit S n=1 Tax=Vreelandella aquamarina TaxID=77097 RepID=UPI00384C12A3
MSAQTLITEHLDLWMQAVTQKSTAGRGRNGKVELTGIKKLRELILELAVRGKLVEQDPDDEPASVLLEQVANEKAQLAKVGKIKKSKKLPDIDEEEKPFGLPDGWLWARMEAISEYIQRGKGPKYAETGGVRVVSQKCVQWSGFDLSVSRFVDDSSLDGYQDERYIRDGDVLWNSTGTGTVGRAIVIKKPQYSIVADSHVTIVRLVIAEPRYVLNYISSPSVQHRIEPGHENSLVSGTTKQVELNSGSVKLLPVPLPPLKEQNRIVQKVDELMALCDRLEQYTSDQLDAHETLVDTLLGTLTQSANATELADNWVRLSEHFDTLFTTEQSIDKLKQTILQLAVMGRLVEQDAGDESAHTLLNRLTDSRQAWLHEKSSSNPECKTMLRKLGKLRPAQPPFPLPRGWQPAHLIQLCRMLVDCHNKTAPYVEEGIPIIRTSNIRGRRFNFNEIKYVNEETYAYWSRRSPPEPGDIIFTREAPMGEAAIIPEGRTWCLGQRTMLIRPMHEHINNSFLLLALTEPHLLERAAEKAIGSTVKHLRVGDVENLVVPVPPLAEQHRIVQKVDELMAICDQLKERLNQASNTRCQLAGAIVEQGLSV